MRLIPIAITSLSLLLSNYSYADCAADDAPCLAALAADVAESNSEQTLLAVALVGAASWGVYKLVTADDSAEEAQVRAEEFSNGHGIRLNDVHSPFRVSVIRPILNSQDKRTQYADPHQPPVQVGIINLMYEW